MVEELRSMKLERGGQKVEDGIEETLTYCDFPSEHWTRIRTNNVTLNDSTGRDRRRTRGGQFPRTAIPYAGLRRLRHVAGTVGQQEVHEHEASELPARMPPLPADFTHTRVCKPFLKNP